MPTKPEQRTAAIDFRMLGWFILATVPAVVSGIWMAGHNALGAPTDPATTVGWLAELSGDGLTGPLRAWLLGFAFFLPRLVLAAAVSYGWATLFAKTRQRALDPGWLYAAWLFTLLLPAATPLPMVAIGLSFGLVFGCHAFGGSGSYIVNPALLGAIFLHIAYPGELAGHWVPDTDLVTTWSVAATRGLGVLTDAGISLSDLVTGREVAAMGVPAAGLCLAGGLFLVLKRLAPWEIVAGSLLGLALAGSAFESVPWLWQPMFGSFAFVAAFVATDPTTSPSTRAGRWVLGLAFGALTIAIRMLNPEHPEGTLFALLLACLMAPLADHWAARAKNRGPEG